MKRQRNLALLLALCLVYVCMAACNNDRNSNYDPAHDTDRPSSGEYFEEIEAATPRPTTIAPYEIIEEGYYYGRKLIEFGGYEWIVLEEMDGNALVLCKDIIENKAYHEIDEDVTWENSTIRAYLNGEFYDRFSNEEKARILETQVINDAVIVADGEFGGDDTDDYIFLLSRDEADVYFADDWGKHRTMMVRGEIVVYERGGREMRMGTWWLRSPGFNIILPGHPVNRACARVMTGTSGLHTVDNELGIRPVMWIILE